MYSDKNKRKERIPWEHINIIEKRNVLKQLSLKMKDNLDKLIKKLRQLQIIRNPLYLIVNKITGRKTTNRSKIKTTDDKEPIQKWKQHLSLSQGKNPITTDQEIVKIVDKELQIESIYYRRTWNGTQKNKDK